VLKVRCEKAFKDNPVDRTLNGSVANVFGDANLEKNNPSLDVKPSGTAS
jgi:hypothetical protein